MSLSAIAQMAANGTILAPVLPTVPPMPAFTCSSIACMLIPVFTSCAELSQQRAEEGGPAQGQAVDWDLFDAEAENLDDLE